MVLFVDKVNSEGLFDFIDNLGESDRVVEHVACYEEEFGNEDTLADGVVLEKNSDYQLADGGSHTDQRDYLDAVYSGLLFVLMNLDRCLILHVDFSLEQLHSVDNLGDNDHLRNADAHAEAIVEIVRESDLEVGQVNK